MDDENGGWWWVEGGICKIVNVLEKELRNYLRIKITRQKCVMAQGWSAARRAELWVCFCTGER